VSWQPRNIAKRPGEMRRNSLAHVARGADGVLFFQWRASRFGAEKHHSAMLPQGGTDTRVWREVAALGGELATLADIKGSIVEPDLAITWDWESWWAHELEWRPSIDLGYTERVRAWYEASFRAGLTADFAHPRADLSRYRLVVVPSLYLTPPQAAANLRDYVAGGGTLVVGCFSGIVDGRDQVYPGPYPGALRDVLGLTVEEWLPLRSGDQVTLSWEENGAVAGRAEAWTEAVRLAGAKPVARYADGPAAGGPAVTRYELGDGQAWYVSARTDAATTAALLSATCEAAGITAPARPAEPAARPAEPAAHPAGSAARPANRSASPGYGGADRADGGADRAGFTAWPRDLEIVRRCNGQRRFVTLINHGGDDATVRLGGRVVTVAGGDVLVIKGDTE
jgi:beta-galactosidase